MARPERSEMAAKTASARAVWSRVRAERIERQAWPPILRKGGLLIKKAIVVSALAGACFGAGLASAPQAEVRAVNAEVAAGLNIEWTRGISLSLRAAADSVSFGEKAVDADKAVAEAAAKQAAAVPDFLRPAASHAQADADTGPSLR